MKKIILMLLAIIYLQQFSIAQDASPYFASNPALTPDGQTLIFSYDGDLWKAPSDGGASTRITAMQGNTTNPRISPDGKWLAFSNAQFGNYDIYLMPLEGGTIKRLTFHAGSATIYLIIHTTHLKIPQPVKYFLMILLRVPFLLTG